MLPFAVCQDINSCYSGFGPVGTGDATLVNGQPYLVPGMNFSCDGNISQVVARLGHPGTITNLLSLGVILQIWAEVVEASISTSYSLVTTQALRTNIRDEGTYTFSIEPTIAVSSGYFLGFLDDSTSVFRRYTRQVVATSVADDFTILRQTANPSLATDVLQFYDVTTTVSPLLTVQFSEYPLCTTYYAVSISSLLQLV